MHISCSYHMSYVITFDIWEVRVLSYCLTLFAVYTGHNLQNRANHQNEDFEFSAKNSNVRWPVTKPVKSGLLQPEITGLLWRHFRFLTESFRFNRKCLELPLCTFILKPRVWALNSWIGHINSIWFHSGVSSIWILRSIFWHTMNSRVQEMTKIEALYHWHSWPCFYTVGFTVTIVKQKRHSNIHVSMKHNSVEKNLLKQNCHVYQRKYHKALSYMYR